MYQELYSTALQTKTIEDGRLPIEKLLNIFNSLLHDGRWRRQVVTNQAVLEPDHQGYTHFPIYNFYTAKSGPALWVLAGVHGEEPAGPMAVAENLEVLKMLAANGVPIVLFGLCNALGYYRDQRHPDPVLERSVTEADHLMVHLEDKTRARIDSPATYESWAINNRILELLPDYPPLMVVDLHEDKADVNNVDEASHKRFSTYLYVLSKLMDQHSDPVARSIINIWREHHVDLWKNGMTRFDELVENGLVTINPGEGSVDEFLAIDTCVVNGVIRPKPAAKIAITTETPTIDGVWTPAGLETRRIPVADRVLIQGLVLQALPALWALAKKTYL